MGVSLADSHVLPLYYFVCSSFCHLDLEISNVVQCVYKIVRERWAPI